MTDLIPPVPGFVAFTAVATRAARALAEAVVATHGDGTVVELDEHSAVATWGLPVPERSTDWQAVLGAPLCRADGALSAADVCSLLDRNDPGALLADVVPPFAAAGWSTENRSIVAIVDWLGFRHLYLAAGSGWTAVSSSAASLAARLGAHLDPTSLMVQSLLGWQTGDDTLHVGVRKVPAGHRVELQAGTVRTTSVVPLRASSIEHGARVQRAAADVVGSVVRCFLDDNDDAFLQLTGGLDSRILLGAIPKARRSQVEALTLAVPGSPDTWIAARIAREQGMRHRVIDLDGLDDVDAGAAHEMVVAASRRVEGMADPLALAALFWAERELGARPRLAGLGGEVARGFYYFGPPMRLPVRPTLSAGLARWRMFPNESVDSAALRPEFVEQARRVATAEVHNHLVATGGPWWPATDEFYLWQRMQRWAGTLASATAFDRSTVNPMLSRRFIDLARGLEPAKKRNMRFLSTILLELDPALADIELDHRPSPRTYAEPAWANSWRLGRMQMSKVARKAGQRASGARRPPAGGEILATKVVQHWRDDAAAVEPVLRLGLVHPRWLDQMLSGSVEPTPSTVSFLVNVVEALRGTTGQIGTQVSEQLASAGRARGSSSARMEARD